ncbi:MAG: NTP transferase domain-containing protein [bacterium]|nr:NTP transferase domain-containing protein [bacterium]
MMTTAEPSGPGRGDVVLVLCRGASRRFGAPKALATVGTDPRPLLARVAATYARTDLGLLLVVTTADQVQGCCACLDGADAPAFAVVAGTAGGDTALTMALASAWLQQQGQAVTRVWAHPVDLPRVRHRTLVQLARVAASVPALPVRPAWGGQPGHPVVVPHELLARLAPAASASDVSWRAFYAGEVAAGRAHAAVEVPVADPGVVLDHDDPGDPAWPDGEG